VSGLTAHFHLYRGARVRCQRAYFATGADTQSASLAILLRALAAPLDATAISLMASAKRTGDHWELALA